MAYLSKIRLYIKNPFKRVRHYSSVDLIPVGNFMHASKDIRYMLVLDDYNHLPTVSIYTYRKLIKAYLKICVKAFGKKDVSKTTENKAKMFYVQYSYGRQLINCYYTITSPLLHNIRIKKLLIDNGYSGTNYKGDLNKLKQIKNKYNHLADILKRNKKNKQHNHSAENYCAVFEKNIIKIANIMHTRIDIWDFRLIEYLRTLEFLKEDAMKSRNKNGN